MHKLTTRLARTHGTIVVEHLNLKRDVAEIGGWPAHSRMRA